MCWRKKKKKTRIVLVKQFDENGSVEKGSRVSKAGNCFLSAFFESLFQSGRGFSREFSKECLNVYRRSVNRFYATAFSGWLVRNSFPIYRSFFLPFFHGRHVEKVRQDRISYQCFMMHTLVNIVRLLFLIWKLLHFFCIGRYIISENFGNVFLFIICIELFYNFVNSTSNYYRNMDII